MAKLSAELSSLTGFPKLPHWILRLFLRYPSLVPMRVRWKIASKGLGLLVSELIKSKEDNDSKSGDLVKACRQLGLKQGQKVKAEFSLTDDDFNETLRVVVFANRLFGINSRIAEKNGQIAKTRITKCTWAGSSYWNAKPCGALSAWELGLVEGLNPNVKVKFLKRMSKGDDYCEAEYRMETN
jgi:hypothetical protein